MAIAPYILMVVFMHGYGSRPNIVFQEFNSKETCEAAAAKIPGMFNVTRDKINQAVCTPK